MTSIVVEEGNPIYDSREHCNAIIETSTNSLIAGCKNTIIPNSITTIGAKSFSWNGGLVQITIPSSVISIEDDAFCGSGLTDIFIPGNVKIIHGYAFCACENLKYVKIGNGVDSIEARAFLNTNKIEYIIIPTSVKYIGYNAFYNGYIRPSIYCKNPNPIGLNEAFGGHDAWTGRNNDEIYHSSVLYVPKGAMNNYLNSDWKKFWNIKEYEDELSLAIDSSEDEVDNGTIVKLSCNYSDAKIYYTTDGSLPTKNSNLYTSSGITINKTQTIRAIALLDNYVPSDILTKTYKVK